MFLPLPGRTGLRFERTEEFAALDVRRTYLTDFADPGFARESLPPQEWAWLEAHWKPEQLVAERVLCDTDCTCDTMWLLDDAVTARVARDDGGHSFEIGVDGPGRLGCAWVAGGDRLSPWRVEVRRTGMARALARRDVELLASAAPVFHARCRAAVHAEVLELAAQFALSRRRTARSLLAERLAGYFTAFGETAVAITHSTLARRLNLRRATVTLALQELEGARAIRSYRGRIELKDRDQLLALAHEI